MALVGEYQLLQAALEIQYERGFAYFDRCGSLVMKLQDVLGIPRFEASVPDMLHGELRNDAERMVIQYAPNRFSVTQQWPPSPARFEQLAPLGWETVVASLGVGGHVIRFGVRFFLLWKGDSLDECIRCVEGSGFGRWQQIFGQRQPQSVSALVSDTTGGLRVGLDAVSFSNLQDGGLLSVSLAPLVPRFAVQLDLDHVHPSSVEQRLPANLRVPFALNRAQTREFIRTSWTRSLDIATKARTLLGEIDGN